MNMRSRVYFILGMLCISVGVAAISWKLGLIWIGVISFILSYLEFDEESKE